MSLPECVQTYVIEESNAGGNGDLLFIPCAGLAVEVYGDLDVGLVCLALNRRRPCCHFQSFGLSRQGICSLAGGARVETRRMSQIPTLSSAHLGIPFREGEVRAPSLRLDARATNQGVQIININNTSILLC